MYGLANISKEPYIHSQITRIKPHLIYRVGQLDVLVHGRPEPHLRHRSPLLYESIPYSTKRILVAQLPNLESCDRDLTAIGSSF